MTHYQNLATPAFRFIGFLLVLMHIIWGINFFFQFWWLQPQENFVSTSISYNAFRGWGYLYGIISIFAGAVIFAKSRSLARWVCFDIDKDNEQ